MEKVNYFVGTLEGVDLSDKQKEKISNELRELLLKELAQIDNKGDIHIRQNFNKHPLFDFNSTFGVWIDFDWGPQQVGTIYWKQLGGVGEKHNQIARQVLKSGFKTKDELFQNMLDLEVKGLSREQKEVILKLPVYGEKYLQENLSGGVYEFINAANNEIKTFSSVKNLNNRLSAIFEKAMDQLEGTDLAIVHTYIDVTKSSSELWAYKSDGGDGDGAEIMAARYGNGNDKIKSVVAADGAGATGVCLSTGLIGGFLSSNPITGTAFAGAIAFGAAWASCMNVLLGSSEEK
jgi:hypothetical protein